VINDAEIMRVHSEILQLGTNLVNVHLAQCFGSGKNGGAATMTKKNGLAAENGAVVDVIRCENDVISFASETHREAGSHKGWSVAIGYI